MGSIPHLPRNCRGESGYKYGVLLGSAANIAISSLGWIDGGNLWTFDAAAGRETTIPLGGAKYLSLHGGSDDHLAVVHHYDGPRVEITVHHSARLAEPLARAVVEPAGPMLSGDPEAWSH